MYGWNLILLCNSFFQPALLLVYPPLRLTRTDDLDSSLWSTAGSSESLNSLDNLHRLGISYLSEDDVLAVQPRCDDSGDEELGTVGVSTGVGHREEAGLGVLQLEVLVCELLAVDGLATSALLPAVSNAIQTRKRRS